jgi:glutaminyl-peptide cyclotransferase
MIRTVFGDGERNRCAAVLLVFAAACVGSLFSHVGTANGALEAVPVYGFKTVTVYPHDSNAFTQGFEYFGGFLYESTGKTGHSSLRKVELASGNVLQRTQLAPQYFGEGLTIFRGKIYQITWLSNTGFVYDLKTFRRLSEFQYYGEGWGLTHDDENLILSDGTNRLRYLDPETFKVVRTVEVYAGEEAVPNLNELEFIEGDIYANVWHSNRIARIVPATGMVRAWIDFSSLAPQEQKDPESVLNGIAFDAAQHRFFVTGKNWSHVYETRIDGIPF